MSDALLNELQRLQAENFRLHRELVASGPHGGGIEPPETGGEGTAGSSARPGKKKGINGWRQRVQLPDGSRPTFWARTKKELAIEIGTAIKGAERLRVAQERNRRKRRQPKVPPKTLYEARDRLERSYQHDKASWSTHAGNMNRILDWELADEGTPIGAYDIPEIDNEDLAVALNELREHGNKRTGEPLSATTIRGTIKSTRFLYASLEDTWGYTNVARKLVMPEGVKDVDPFESWDEVFALARAFTTLGFPGYGRLVRFVCATLLRPQEWAVLRHCDLDRQKGTVTVNRSLRNGDETERTKTDGSHATLWLPELALEAIEDIPSALPRQAADWKNSPLMFDQPDGTMINLHAFRRIGGTSRSKEWPDGPWTQALKLAGLRHRPPKQMRHTGAYLALMAGVPLEDVSLMARHDSVKTTERYYLDRVPKMARRSIETMNLNTTRYSLAEAG